MRISRRCCALAAWLLAMLPALAWAECSRAVQVPVAAIGFAVTVVDGKIGGIYPDLLRGPAARSGCSMSFQVVPRARQEMLFETGQADLLLPARRSAHRDESGVFVPMIKSRAALVTLQSERPQATSLAELLQRHDLRVVVVRGYDYGDAYLALLKDLSAQGRLLQAADPASMGRMLDGQMADVAIVTPTILSGELRGNARLKHMLPRLRYQVIDDLPWGESGIYVSSKSSLSKADRQQLQELLEQIARSGAAWRLFQHYYPDEQLIETVRPR